MAAFGIRFFLCNILICATIGIFLMIKQVLRNHLTSRMQFNLWFLLLGLLAVPFIPIRPAPFSQLFSLLDKWKNAASPNTGTVTETAVNVSASGTTGLINDFALSVSGKTPSVIGLILSGIWLAGIFAMLLLVMKSKARLNNLKKSALPLQSKEVRMLYGNCLSELKIKRDIPIYSTAFLKSPIIVGLFRPCIYLPIHLISDFHVNAEEHKGISEGCFNAADMRYMLLHEYRVSSLSQGLSTFHSCLGYFL